MIYEPDEIIRSRRRTLSLEIKKDGRFVVHAPLYVNNAEIEEFVLSKQKWIIKNLENCSLRIRKALNVDHSEGSSIPFLGRMITLGYHDRRSLTLEGSEVLNMLSQDIPSDFSPLENVCLKLPSPAFRHKEISLLETPLSPEAEAEENRLMINSWYRQQAASVLKARTALYASRMGLKYSKVGITKARTSWGSCNAKYGINYSLHLICVSIWELDYVVVHELSHILHRDHSAAFYKEIEKILPDYKKRNRSLEQNTWVLEI